MKKFFNFIISWICGIPNLSCRGKMSGQETTDIETSLKILKWKYQKQGDDFVCAVPNPKINGSLIGMMISKNNNRLSLVMQPQLPFEYIHYHQLLKFAEKSRMSDDSYQTVVLEDGTLVFTKEIDEVQDLVTVLKENAIWAGEKSMEAINAVFGAAQGMTATMKRIRGILADPKMQLNLGGEGSTSGNLC